MNSVERVKNCIHFENPDKVPVFKGLAGDISVAFSTPSKNWNPGWDKKEEGLFPHVDIRLWNWNEPKWVKKNPNYRNGNWTSVFPRQEIDEWGRIWNMSSKGDIGHPGRASLPDWAKLQEYLDRNTPDVYDHARYDLSKRLLEIIGEDKYKIFMLGLGPVEIAAGIRGFSNFLIDHKRNPEKLNKLLQNLTKHFIDSMKASFRYGINPHGFILFDDLGSQQGPFFGRKTFEQFYDRVYSTIISEAHDLGCEVFLHCCGKVDQLIPLFIKWGLDVIEFDSPRMSGYTDLSPYRGKISMWGCINIQSIYPFGTPEECEREVWHMVRNLGTKHGGFGAYYYPQFNVIQVPHENIKAFDRGLKKFGDYSKIPPYWWDIQVPKSWKNDKEQDIIPPLPVPNN